MPKTKYHVISKVIAPGSDYPLLLEPLCPKCQQYQSDCVCGRDSRPPPDYSGDSGQPDEDDRAERLV